MTKEFVVLRLMALEPQNLWRGETGHNEIAREPDRRLGAAEFLGDDRAFGRRARVAPELGRSDDVAVFIERDKAMLLARNADAAHLLRLLGADARGDFRQHKIKRRGPVLRMLLHVTHGQAFDEFVGARASAMTLRVARSRTTALTLWVPESMPM